MFFARPVNYTYRIDTWLLQCELEDLYMQAI